MDIINNPSLVIDITLRGQVWVDFVYGFCAHYIANVMMESPLYCP